MVFYFLGNGIELRVSGLQWYVLLWWVDFRFLIFRLECLLIGRSLLPFLRFHHGLEHEQWVRRMYVDWPFVTEKRGQSLMCWRGFVLFIFVIFLSFAHWKNNFFWRKRYKFFRRLNTLTWSFMVESAVWTDVLVVLILFYGGFFCFISLWKFGILSSVICLPDLDQIWAFFFYVVCLAVNIKVQVKVLILRW